jgi:hypothetical protein
MLSATATSIVQLIGIITMTTSLSNDGHLQAVAPKIPALKSSALHTERMATQASDTIHDATDDVEPHTALILFRTCDYVSSQGWPPMALEKEKGFLYVQLAGERIEIVPEGRRSPQTSSRTNFVKPKLNIPYVTHLADSCPTFTDVNGAFKEPDFIGAATVIDLPFGTVDACKGNPHGGSTSRIDTRVTIPNSGHIVLHATRPKDKQIVLAGNARIYVAHIPSSYITGKQPQDFHSPHFRAYYSMSMGHDCPSASGMKVMMPSATKAKSASGVPDLPPVCEASPVVANPDGMSTVSVPHPPDIVSLLDMQCSTTSWP